MSKKDKNPVVATDTPTALGDSAPAGAEPTTPAVETGPTSEAAVTSAPIAEPVTEEALRPKIADLQRAAHDLHHGIETTLREADAAQRQANSKFTESENFAFSGDVSGRDALLREIPALRQRAKALRGGIGPHMAELARLDKETQVLRGQAGELFTRTESRLKEIEAAKRRVVGLMGQCSLADLDRARDLLEKWKQQIGIVDPPPVAKAEPSKPKRPLCPRCRSNAKVKPFGDGGTVWECSTPFHGPLRFNHLGKILWAPRLQPGHKAAVGA